MTPIKAASNQHIFKPNIVQRSLSAAGRIIPDKVHDFCDLSSKGSMGRLTFVALASVFLLGARYFQARNKDERREVATRDFSAVITAVYAVPVLRKFAGMLINKQTGIPISQGEKGFLKNLNPEGGVQIGTYDELKQWLSIEKAENFDKFKNKFTGFVSDIKEMGGNLTKCFNILDKNSDKLLADLAGAIGMKDKITNDNILELIGKAENSTDHKVQELLTKLKKLFELKPVVDTKPPLATKFKNLFFKSEEGMNPLLRRASHLKSATEFSCIASTAFLLGGLLPWFNIHHTRKLYLDPKNGANKGLSTTPTPTQTPSTGHSNVIDKFEKFKQTGCLN